MAVAAAAVVLAASASVVSYEALHKNFGGQGVKPKKFDPETHNLLEARLNVSMEERFFYKHIAFSWENEFRLMLSVRMAEEFGVEVPEHGVEATFDLNVLVEKIYLGPSLTGGEIETIKTVAGLRGLADRIHTSSLLGQPRYI